MAKVKGLRLGAGMLTSLIVLWLPASSPARATGIVDALPPDVGLVIQVDLGALFEPEQVQAVVQGALVGAVPVIGTLTADVRRIERVTFLSFAEHGSTAIDSGAFVIEGGFETRRVHRVLAEVAIDGFENLSVASLPDGSVAFGDPSAVRRLVTSKVRRGGSSSSDVSLRKTLARVAAPKSYRRAFVVAMRGFAHFSGLSAAFHVSEKGKAATRRPGALMLYGATSRAAAKALAEEAKALLTALASRRNLENMRDQLFGPPIAGLIGTLATDAAAELIGTAKIRRPSRRSVRLTAHFDCAKLLAVFVASMRVSASMSQTQGQSQTL